METSAPAILNMNFANVPQNEGFEALPVGWYNATLIALVETPTKDFATNGGNMYYAAQYKIFDGQYAGRVVFGNFNHKNQNPVAQDIGMKQLSSLAHAVGKLEVGSAQEWFNIPFKLRLKMSKTTAEYPEARNEVADWKSLAEAPATAGGATGLPAGFGAPAVPAAAAPAVPTPPAAPAAPAAPPAPVAFPPADWTPHPTSPGYFYKGQEVLTEAELRAKMAPAVPAAPATPAAPAVAAAAAPVAAAGTPPWLA